MKPLLRIMITLALIFTSTLIIAKTTGLLSVDRIESWFHAAKELPPHYTAMIVISLLVADLIISVPTMTIMILSGYFLGHALGALAGITGLMLTGSLGYLLSFFFGNHLAALLIKDDASRNEAKKTFLEHGIVVILLSRAVPVLPEVSACMAGITRMPLTKFLPAWAASTIPYTLVATYAGSISSLKNPLPAIITGIGITATFWFGWYIFRIRNKRRQKA